MNDLYSFVCRALLTEASLDRTARQRRRHFRNSDANQLQRTLSFDLLDPELLVDSAGMSLVFVAIHAFENTVRRLVIKAMAEGHGDSWWSHVPDRIQNTVKCRMAEEAKFRWHGPRGSTEINYCSFGDLSSIIVNNWSAFEPVIANLEWAKGVLNTLEKSRNIIMHGGILAKEDIERVGMNIRDWVRQTG